MFYGESGSRYISEIIDNSLISFWYSVANASDIKIPNIFYRYIKTVYDLDVYKFILLDKNIT